MAKRETTAITADVFKTVLTLTFANGKSLEVDATQLSPEIQMQAMLHGLKQKLVDAAAMPRDRETGRPATIHDKFEAVREVYDRIKSPNGTWNRTRGDSVEKVGGLLVQALVNLSNGKHDAQYIRDYLENKTKEERAAIRASDRVSTEIARIKGTAGKGDDLLADLLASDDTEPEPEAAIDEMPEPVRVEDEPLTIVKSKSKPRAKKVATVE